RLGGRRHDFGAVYLSRRDHLQPRLYRLAEAANLREHHHWRPRRILRRAGRGGSERPAAAMDFDHSGRRPLPVDTAAFLEPRCCEGGRLHRRGRADAACDRAGEGMDAGDPVAYGDTGDPVAHPAVVRHGLALWRLRSRGWRLVPLEELAALPRAVAPGSHLELSGFPRAIDPPGRGDLPECDGGMMGMLAIGIASLAALLLASPSSAARIDADEALARSEAAIGAVISDHRLLRSDGSSFRMVELKGKPLVVSLIYTSCSTVCPASTQTLKEAVRHARATLGRDSFQVLT